MSINFLKCTSEWCPHVPETRSNPRNASALDTQETEQMCKRSNTCTCDLSFQPSILKRLTFPRMLWILSCRSLCRSHPTDNPHRQIPIFMKNDLLRLVAALLVATCWLQQPATRIHKNWIRKSATSISPLASLLYDPKGTILWSAASKSKVPRARHLSLL